MNRTILYIITRSDVVGGASVHLIDLIRHANIQGDSVHVAMGGTGEFSHLLEQQESCNVHEIVSLKRELSPVSDIKAVREIRGLIQTLSPDIVHLHSAKAGITGRLATIGLGVPTIFTVHGWPFIEGIPKARRAFYLAIEWVMSWLPTQIITVSKQDLALAKQYRFANLDKMSAIQNGVAPSPLNADKRLEASRDRLRFTMVARFDAPKRQNTVLRALAKCQSNRLVVDFVGDGPALQDAKGLVGELGLDECVRFHGHLLAEQVREVLGQSDGFVLISDWEGLPLTIIEAMSSGLPIIASDVGGVSELVVDGETGFLIPRENAVEALADTLQRYLEQPALLQAQGTKGKAYYDEDFTLEAMLSKTFALYDEVLK